MKIINKKIMYSALFLLLLMCGLSFGILFDSQMVTQEVDNSTPKSSAGEITILTPENKIYTESMSGYYPATFGFENDQNGVVPERWVVIGGSVLDTIEVINEMNNHKKIMDMNKGNSYGTGNQIRQFFGESQEFGTLEFWILTSDITKATAFHPMNGTTALCGVGFGDTPDFAVHTLGGWQNLPFVASDNTWYHVSLQFECGMANHYGLDQYYFRVLIDGVNAGEFKFYSNQSVTDNFMVLQNWPYENYHTYLDGLGYSWDPGYQIGDNFYEGLLLSFDNSTNLDWKGYSLDGQSNKTILGNTTIPLPSDGVHSIQVFGNDSIDTMYESNLRYFTVNTAPPDITINSPIDSQIIGSTAPNYDLTITGPYDSIWYALEGGINYSVSGLTGTIDQSAWSALSDGIITIDFYANNSAGMEGSAQVMVVKYTSEEPPPTPPGIPGYNLIALVGVCCIVTLIMIKKKRGRIKP